MACEAGATANARVDVIVVRAGVSGLSAARLLHQPQRLAVLEARARFWGRTTTCRFASLKHRPGRNVDGGPSRRS